MFSFFWSWFLLVNLVYELIFYFVVIFWIQCCVDMIGSIYYVPYLQISPWLCSLFGYWCWPLYLSPFICSLVWGVSYSIWPISCLSIFSTREVLEGAIAITAFVVSILFYRVQLELIVSDVPLLVIGYNYFWVLLTHSLYIWPFRLHHVSIYSCLLLYLASSFFLMFFFSWLSSTLRGSKFSGLFLLMSISFLFLLFLFLCSFFLAFLWSSRK
jgi:hypothetical protein